MIAASAYGWWVFVHIAGAFGFFFAHGASAAVALKLRREREPERIRALLEVSEGTFAVMYVSLLVLLAGGIVAGFLGRWWGQGWIWTAIGVLVVVIVAMYALASTYYERVREAVGIPPYKERRKGAPTGPPKATPGELDGLLSSSRPLVVTVVGVGGLVVILWLMVLKPF